MTNRRFEEVYKEGTLTATRIIRDNETGVQYLVHQEGFSVGVSVLVNEEGKPLIEKNVKK